MANDSKNGQGENHDDLEETKRIMERLVRTPPKPHKKKGGAEPEPRGGKASERPSRSKKPTK